MAEGAEQALLLQGWIREKIPFDKKVFMKVGVIHELPLVSHPDCREKALPFPLWERASAPAQIEPGRALPHIAVSKPLLQCRGDILVPMAEGAEQAPEEDRRLMS